MLAKLLPLVVIVTGSITLTGCSHLEHSSLTSSKVLESNSLVTDIEQIYQVDGACFKHEQNIAELSNFNTSPKAFYTLTQKRITCKN
ncbi:hypothetical protein [Photobacterium damselae]|uniref:hypothetical protein n=1 Tax=Photobacterium damselae TaxID=38293 RepID=UPI00406910D6